MGFAEENRAFCGYYIGDSKINISRQGSGDGPFVSVRIADNFSERAYAEQTLRGSGFVYSDETKIWRAPLSDSSAKTARSMMEILDKSADERERGSAVLMTYPDSDAVADDGFVWLRCADGSGGLYSGTYPGYSVRYDEAAGDAWLRMNDKEICFYSAGRDAWDAWDFESMKAMAEPGAKRYVLDELKKKSRREHIDGQEVYKYEHGKYAARICHAVKDGIPAALSEMAEYMAGKIDRDEHAVLVPVPNHTGKAEYTLDLAEKIKALAGENIEVADILECDPHETLYEQKKTLVERSRSLLTDAEKDSLDTGNIRLKAGADTKPLEGKKIYAVDNVISTGKTFGKIRELVPGIEPLVFAAGAMYIEEQKMKRDRKAVESMRRAVADWRKKRTQDDGGESLAVMEADCDKQHEILAACRAEIEKTLLGKDVDARMILTGWGEGDAGEPVQADDCILGHIEKDMPAARYFTDEICRFEDLLHRYYYSENPGITKTELAAGHKKSVLACNAIGSALPESIRETDLYRGFCDISERIRGMDTDSFASLYKTEKAEHSRYKDMRIRLELAKESERCAAKEHLKNDPGYISDAEKRRVEAERRSDWEVTQDLHTGEFEFLGVMKNMTRGEAFENARRKFSIAVREDIRLSDLRPEKKAEPPEKKAGADSLSATVSESDGWTIISCGDSVSSIRILHNGVYMMRGNEDGKLEFFCTKETAEEEFACPGNVMRAACEAMGLESDEIPSRIPVSPETKKTVAEIKRAAVSATPGLDVNAELEKAAEKHSAEKSVGAAKRETAGRTL